MNVTIKDYGQEFGLSTRFHDRDQMKDFYQIKGPMGRGLGLTKDSQGSFYAFTAGTGILPFLDLISRIALSELDLIPNEQKLNKNFKMLLFASFASEEEAIALELLQ